MNVSRIATAGSLATPTPRIGPSAREASTQHKRVEPAAIVQVRSHLMRGLDGARGGHSIQEAGNMDSVPNHALQQVRSVLQRGWDSMRGGHKIQQATYEPTVSNRELTQNIRRMESNVSGFAGGSKVQAEARTPTHADRDYGPRAKKLAQAVAHKIKEARPELPQMQAAKINRSTATQLLG